MNNREALSQIAFFVESAREDAITAARLADKLGLPTAHRCGMTSLDALDGFLEAVRQADTAAELLEGIGT